MRLVRTIQIGAAQDIAVDDIRAYALGSEASYAGHVLARSALLVLDEDRGFSGWPAARLLDRTLTQLQQQSHHFAGTQAAAIDLPAEHLVFTSVYAMVMAGQADAAVEVLERHTAQGSDYKRDVVLQALRNIGSPGANAVIQRAGEAGWSGNLAENLLADHHYPFIIELYERRDLIHPGQRTRSRLLKIAGEECGERAAIAVYFLGFFDNEHAAAAAETIRLRELAGVSCFYTRFFARRALALRSAESLRQWSDYYHAEADAWQRAQLVRIGFARFGRDFLPAALEWLGDEPVQYVQWELMHGNLQVRRGARWREYWDVWLPPTLQFRLDHAVGAGDLPNADLQTLLAWLEGGSQPRDPWVRNHFYHGLAGQVGAGDVRRFLSLFNALADKTEQWWVLSPLDEPEALPALRYWQTLESSEQQQTGLENIVRRLEARQRDRSGAGEGCCTPDAQCLIERAAAAVNREARIDSENDLNAWLADPGSNSIEPRIVFTDRLQRAALVHHAAGDSPEHWQHIFGCWRRLD